MILGQKFDSFANLSAWLGDFFGCLTVCTELIHLRFSKSFPTNRN